jgi:hypothetical protein
LARIGVAASAMLALTLISLEPAVSASASSRSSVPACQGDNLLGTFTGSEGGLSNGIYSFAIMNVGASKCRLGGFPQLKGYRGKHFYALRADHGYELDAKLRPTVLRSRMSGAFVLDATTGCMPDGDPHPAEHTYLELVLVLAKDQGSVAVPSLTLYVPCQLSESALGWSKGFTFVTEYPH